MALSGKSYVSGLAVRCRLCHTAFASFLHFILPLNRTAESLEKGETPMTTKKWKQLIPAAVALWALLLFALLRPQNAGEFGEELLLNGSFSEISSMGSPASWHTEAYTQEAGYTDFALSEETDGSFALHIVNHLPNDARFAQEVAVEPDSLYCLSGQIRAQAEGGRGANLSIADVYTFSAGVYDTQGAWQQVTLYGKTGRDQHTLTVFARLGGYSGESQGEAWFAGLSLKKVEAAPAEADIALFYQPAQAAAAQTVSLDLRHGLLAVFVLMYAGLICECFRAESLLGLLFVGLVTATFSLFFLGSPVAVEAEAISQTDAAMPYVPYVVLGLSLATWIAAAVLGSRLARQGKSISLPCGRKPSEAPPAVFLRDEKANHLRPRRLNGKDAALMLGMTALYAAVAYYQLGSPVSPQTAFTFTQAGEQVTFDLGDAETDFRMLYMGGIHQRDNGFTVQLSEDGEIWTPAISCSMDPGSLYQWFYVHGSSAPDTRALAGRYVRLTASAPGLTLLETLFRDKTGAVLPVTATSSAGHDVSALLDEQDTLTGEPSWYNSMYFDEIYHARTAYEHLHGLQPYEVSHPPLGKVLMSWSIGALGMTPFGWRFAGATCGICMLPGLYLLGRLLFAKRRYAVLACLALALDTLHLTQTRIATIDSFVVLFIIWAVYCMLRWFYTDFFGQPLVRSLIPLALSGTCMGLAIASKWTGCFAGVGLAAVFFLGLWRRWRAVKEAAVIPPAQRDAVAVTAAEHGNKRLLLTVASCLIFFVLIPAGIYWCSYLPYFAPSGGITLERIVDAAEYMLWYHGQPGLGMNHPYYAPWYRWPFSEIPMYYAMDRYTPAGYAYSIWAFGNIAVWWTGFAALLAVLYAWGKHQALPVLCRGYREILSPLAPQGERDARPALLLICFGAQFLPWVLVPRGTYIYHYFPSVPFLILCTAYVQEQLCNWYTARAVSRTPPAWTARAAQRADRLGIAVVAVYLLLVAAVFIALYPFASGLLVQTSWLDAVNWFGRLYY